jgi:hypothetical protein
MDSRISKLLRTNTALVLLCVIAICALIYTLKGRDGEEQIPVAHPTPTIAPVSTGSSENSIQDIMDQVPESSPLKHAPARETFAQFVFQGQATTSVALECTDIYDVVLIYPMNIEYRATPVGSVYNRAFPCQKNTSMTRTIDVSMAPLHASTTYYIIRAHQGMRGTWYGPY